MKDRSMKKDEILLILVMGIFVVISIVINGLVLKKSSMSGCDLIYYWRNCAYSIRGYNLEWVKNTSFSLSQIGLNEGGGVGILPYGRMLVQFILPGFLSYNVARIYFRLLLCTVLFLIMIKTKDLFMTYQLSKLSSYILAGFVCVLPCMWGGFLRTENIGGILALFVVLMTFTANKYEFPTAFLLALTLIKPQIGGIFVVLFFLQKRYKLLIKTGVICLISDVVYRIYVYFMNQRRGIILENVNAISNLFSGYAGDQMDSERGVTWFLYYGIFNMLRQIGVPNGIVLVMSMIAGIVFVWALLRIYKRNQDESYNPYIIFAIAEIASLFWFYKSECDALVIIGCNILVPLYWSMSKKCWQDFILIEVYLLGLNCLVGRYCLRFAIPVLSYAVGILVDQLLQIVLFVILFNRIVNNINKGIENNEIE